MTIPLKSLVVVILAAATFLSLLFGSLSFADGAGEVATDIGMPSATPALDSVYAQIQSGFQTLDPIWKKACYDCHSDKTDYPWYHGLPIVKGLIDSDIREARGELDMSGGFPFQSTRQPVDDLHKIRDEISEGAMPPWNYKLMHWSACLTDEEIASVNSWVDSSMVILAAHGVQPSRRNRGSDAEAH